MTTPGSPAIPPIPTRGSGWSNAAVLRTLGLTALFIGAVVALWRASAIVMLIFLGNLFGRAVARGARRLERLHFPRAVAAPVIVLLFAGHRPSPNWSDIYSAGKPGNVSLPSAARHAKAAGPRKK